jgi:hypothetical protein
MISVVDYPVLVFVFCFILFGLSAFGGDFCRRRVAALKEENRDDFSVIQGASLTLLGLLIGFTFSMTITRYDQRKNYEEAEANAIGTEYVRAGLLPAADAARVQELLKDYLAQRVLFYSTRDSSHLQQIDSTTAQLQANLWSTVQARAVAQPTPVNALAAAGMNDVLNSQGYTQAAWWNRIPFEAWVLLTAIGMGCNVLIGYGAHRTSIILFLILPLAVSVSFFLIADIDSPRAGLIRVRPQNLLSLSQSLHSP